MGERNQDSACKARKRRKVTSCGAYQKPRAPIVAVDDVGGAEPQAVDSGRCQSAHRFGIHLCAGENTRIGRHAHIRRCKRTAFIDFTAIARGPSGIRIARRATDTERARGAECCARTSRHDENANAGIVPPFSAGGGGGKVSTIALLSASHAFHARRAATRGRKILHYL